MDERDMDGRDMLPEDWSTREIIEGEGGREGQSPRAGLGTRMLLGLLKTDIR